MKTSRVVSSFSVLLAAAALLAACGNGTPSPQPTIFPCPLTPFPAPPEMLYTEDGATGVPDGNFPLVLSNKFFGNSLALKVGGSIVVPSLAPTPVPSPLPSPAATPLPIFTPAAYAVPQLQTATTYSVVAISSPSPCFPSQESIGTFTTK